MAASLLSTSLGRFRIVSFAEGVSFILLLGIAMPLKYIWQMPEAVRMAGMIHGGLFVTYCVLLFMAKLEQKWTIVQALLLFVASIIPFGFLLAESMFLKKEAKKPSA